MRQFTLFFYLRIELNESKRKFFHIGIFIYCLLANSKLSNYLSQCAYLVGKNNIQNKKIRNKITIRNKLRLIMYNVLNYFYVNL